MATLKDAPPHRRNGGRPVFPPNAYDPTVSELFIGERPWDCLPLNQHLHELWQVLGLDDEDASGPDVESEAADAEDW